MKKLIISLCVLAVLCIVSCTALAEATNYLEMNGQIPDQNTYYGGWQTAYAQCINSGKTCPRKP